MERLTEWLPAGTAANVKYPEGADAVIKSAYKQKAFDRLAAYEDTGLTPTEIDRLNAELSGLRADYNGVMRFQAELLHDKKYLNSRLEASQRREQAVSETIKEAMHIIDKKSCVDYYDNSICMLCKHDNPFMPVDGACEACNRADHFEFICPQEGGE